MGDDDIPAGPPQRYRFRVRTGDGRELISHVARVHLPPPAKKPVTGSPANGYELRKILVSIEGATQGAFHSDPTGVEKPFQIRALQLEFAIRAGHDGSREHEPVSITRELGPSSPQVMQALVANETLPSVLFACYGTPKDGTGGEVEFFNMKLTNARVASATLELPNTRLQKSASLPLTQRVTFTYQSIEWTWKDDGSSSHEDWA